MKNAKLLTLGIATALGLTATSAFAQSSNAHPPESSAQAPSMPGMTMNQGMTGMMQMMEMMGQMKGQSEDMTALMKKLMDSMKAVQSEKDPTALKSKLAEHAALLEQMRSKMLQHDEMMQNMSKSMPGMMSGMMSGMMDSMKKSEPVPSQTVPEDHSAHHPGGETK